MTPVPSPQPATTAFIEELARLAEANVEPADYFSRLLKGLLAELPAAAGGVWLRTTRGGLRLQAEANRQHVGPGETEAERRAHMQLLRQALQQARPFSVQLPGRPGPVVFVPFGAGGQVLGLFELWNASPGAEGEQLLGRVAELAGAYLRRLASRLRQEAPQFWARLEGFVQQAHASLDPSAVARVIVEEGRRLIGCDRLSVALRQGRRLRLLAVSGAEVIEQRSNQVRLMQALLDRVLAWGEPLLYTGARDEGLPAAVLQALDRYLAESGARVLAARPLEDLRESDVRPARSVILLESFEPAAPGPFLDRLEVVGRHAAGALSNAAQYQGIPLRWLWRPLGALRDGIGGGARVAALTTAALVGILAAVLCLVRGPLKMDARGRLLPQERRWIYAPVEGQVVRFEEGVQPGGMVAENQALMLLYDVQLEIRLVQLANEVVAAQQAVEALARQEASAAGEADRLRYSSERRQKEFLRERKAAELRALRERTHADDSRPGTFWIMSPCSGTLLNSNFRETLTHRHVKPSEPLLRIGDKAGAWEVELRIPQNHVAAVVHALDDAAELDVDLMLLSCPTRVFRGKLAHARLASQAAPDPEDPTDPEPVVRGSVRLEGPDIPEAERIPRDLLVAGTEVHARIRCGREPLGYCLFHGLWEFLHERILFAL